MAERSDRQLLEALLEAMERVAAGIGRLEELTCSHNDATRELARRNKVHAEASKRSREAKRSHNDATACSQSDATLQVVKAVDLDQERKEKSKSLQREVIVTPRVVTPPPKPPTGPVWLAYSTAYEARYQAKPVRNAKVNGQLTQLVKRLGDNAAEVSAFYVGHSGAYYGQRGHCIDALLRDAEKLHMEWETGRQLTATEARQREKTRANAEGWNSLLKEPKNGLG